MFLVFLLQFKSCKEPKIISNSVTVRRWPVATATCPEGTTLSGGGGRCIPLGPPGTGWVYLYNNSPVSNTKWEVGCDTPKEQNVKAIAYAICC